MKAKDAIMCTESTRCTATWIFVAWSYKVFFIAGVCRFIIIFPWKSSRSCPDVWKPEVKVKKNRKYQTHFQTLLDICEWKKGENFDLWLLFPLSRSLSTGDAVVTVRHYVRTGSGLDTEWTLQWTGLAQDKRTAQERKGGRTWADSPPDEGNAKHRSPDQSRPSLLEESANSGWGELLSEIQNFAFLSWIEDAWRKFDIIGKYTESLSCWELIPLSCLRQRDLLA